MKLTKVLVGLLAISLCGVAAAAVVKKGMSGADLRIGFLNAIKAKKADVATEFINALKARPGDWVYYRTMIKADLEDKPEWVEHVKTYLGVEPTKKVEPAKTDETKAGAWTWGDEPKWDLALLGDWANLATDLTVAKSLTEDGKTAIKKMAYALDNKKFDSVKAEFPSYDGFIGDVKELNK